MPRRAFTPEHAQASLQALPSDSPSSHTSESSVGRPPLAAHNGSHWTVNSREKNVLPKKPAKSVSLKLSGKPNGGNPTGSLPGTGITGISPVRRSNSGDVSWADHLPEVLARQQLPAPKGSQGPDARSNTRNRPSSCQTSDHPLLVEGSSRNSVVEMLGEKLASTAPAIVQREATGRPPVPTRPSPGTRNSDRRRAPVSSGAVGSTSSPPSPSNRQNGTADADDLDNEGNEVGRVFAPVVAAPLNSLPRGGRGMMGGRGAGFRGVGGTLSRGRGAQNLRSAPPTAEGDLMALLVGGHESARRPPSRPSSSPSVSEVGDAPPGVPRVAWPESGQLEDEEDAVDDSTVAELASQIHRDLLERRLLDNGESMEGEGAVTHDTLNNAQDEQIGGSDTSAGSRWVPRTADARTVLDDTEKALKEAAAKAERKRQELGNFLEELRSRTFESSDTAEKASSSRVGGNTFERTDSDSQRREEPELLVSLPVDFDDLVDLNAQLSTQRASSTTHRRSRENRGPTAPNVSKTRDIGSKESNAEDAAIARGRLQMPAFLQKYFNEEKALEQLPHKRLEKEENEAERVRLPDEEDELQRGLRQIAKLDGLLVRREASGQARLQAAKVDLETARERLRMEADKTQAEKIEYLRQLKDSGLIGSGPASVSSRRTSKCSTIEPFTANSGSVSSRSMATTDGGELSIASSRAAPTVTEDDSLVVWSGWTSTAPTNPIDSADEGHHRSLEVVPTSGTVDAHGHPVTPTNVTDTDTSTFNLTSTTASSAMQPQANSERKRPPTGLSTVAEDEPGDQNGTELMLEDEPVDVVDDPYAEDPEAIDALRRIDEQLQKLVPEQEWEAKSICSFPSRSSAGESIGGKRSVWSRVSGDGPTPAIPMLCEQFEKREVEFALVSIDNRLQEMQCEEAPTAPSHDEIRKLLLQAAHETSAPDTESKVLALIGTAPLQDALSKDSHALVLANGHGASYRDNDSVWKARQILNRLENGDNDWHEAFGEAQHSLSQLEEDMKELEERPGSAMSNAREKAALQDAVPPTSAPFAKRLEELSTEVQSILDRTGPDEGVLEKIRRELQNGDSEENGFQEEGELDSTLIDTEFAYNLGSIDTNERPNLELLKALDIELPNSDGMWDNDDLERVVTAMNEHYGDVLPSINESDEGK